MSLEEERKRKRLRKGTFSCWECKRRKVRCTYEDDSTICTGCVSRATTCLSQEYPENHTQVPEQSSNLGDRLARVEKVLQTLVNKIGATEEGRSVSTTEAPESLGIDVLHQSSEHESAPIFSLFDNAVFGRSKNEEKSAAASPATPDSVVVAEQSSKLQAISRQLAALVPKQEIVNLLIGSSDDWWVVAQHKKPLVDKKYLALDAVHLLPKRHPIIVARALLYLVMLIQLLPSTFNYSQLPFSCSKMMEKWHTAVSTKVLMDDELIGSIEGIECLSLLSIYHLNAARPRSSWLTMRRAINICQLLGVHRRSGRLAKEGEAMSAYYLEDLWLLVTGGDRYISLLLGLPYAISDSQWGLSDFSGEDQGKPWPPYEERYSTIMFVLTGKVIDRNTTGYPDVKETEDIDRELEELHASMPQDWWQQQNNVFPQRSLGFGRTENSNIHFDRLMSQIWYYQLRALLHLPFMLHSEQRYEKSRLICLEASRELIKRYTWFRTYNVGCFSCKVVDFQAFTAATTLLLDLLRPIPSRDGDLQKETDWKLVRDVTRVLEDIARDTPEDSEPDIVATQGLKVLKALQAEQTYDTNIKLAIPYFGTVTILRSSSKPSTPANAAASESKTSSPSNIQPNIPLGTPRHPQYQTMPPQRQAQASMDMSQPYLSQPPHHQQFPIVSFAYDGVHRADIESESLWGDWMLQMNNDVPYQNMFDPHLGTSWYVGG